ncbi:uncharacterized protein AMSG_08805 [Thecamonas trahens ATCC 50062]|uniref:Band 7 domain-containing protein n=1 Tax=Thecamonas trahens ATCC 50062 TaxID=461836 RepID=A0A0L0DM18_THETB|nr:hypothetical protein AMSG_08805 [Thecamonas trahens ATCC 50062]KNC53310.1 hypothetical protein AMSG_08805 [Thecamonas trahens ATCC 50062]|eukprot:XP_013754571.1 hypothetical protein AMSG_08805 [Thecamonas trahens ATCC 50062]
MGNPSANRVRPEEQQEAAASSSRARAGSSSSSSGASSDSSDDVMTSKPRESQAAITRRLLAEKTVADVENPDDPLENLDFVEDVEESEHFVKLHEHEGLLEGLIRLDPDLVSSYSGRRRYFKRKRVPPGHVGLGDNASRTMFFRPGSYTRIGLGRKLPSHAVAPIPGPGGRLNHGDITYAHLRDDQVAVLNIGDESHIIGKGRYIIRTPNHLSDFVSLREPGDLEFKNIIRESQEMIDGELVDRRVEDREGAGFRISVGSVQFLRAEPGYVWAVQRGDGHVRTGEGVTAVRRDEKFIDWLNSQMTTRTTDVKVYLTADVEEAQIKLQLQWRLRDGNLWVRQCKAFEDPFDYFEEKLDSLVQDEIGSYCKSELEQQRLVKFDEFEAHVRPALGAAGEAVGVRLLSIEVRHLRFPVADRIERERRLHEAQALRNQREHDHQTQLKRQELAQIAEAAEAELSREQNAARREAEIAAVRDERELAKVEAESARSRREMEAEQERVRIQGETQVIQAENAAVVAAVEREKRAEAELRIARLEAEAEIVRANAAAEAALKMAKIFSENPEYLKFRELEVQATIEQARIAAVGRFADNPNALLPATLQQQVLRMNGGFDPRDLVISPMGVPYTQAASAPQNGARS